MHAVHFGAGNIGRGFIGEVLNQNGISVVFVDVNRQIIDALREKQSYTIELAEEKQGTIYVDNVYGINNAENPDEVVESIAEASLVTTAIGPKILPLIAPLIAQGIQKRKDRNVQTSLDIIACENMIGGSSFLKKEVVKNASDEEVLHYIEEYIGFPDAAVDRIVPLQTHEDILRVTVEPYKEWVVSTTDLKHPELRLEGVNYVDELEPYIERKLFTVNTGHATTAYLGKYEGYLTIDEALRDEKVYQKVKETLEETGELMIDKWDFNPKEHNAYIEKILSRFQNPQLSDDITRVGRTPIRKLGYDERFIRPLRESNERGLNIDALVETVSKALVYNDVKDEESVELQVMLTKKSVREVVKEVTQLHDNLLIDKIVHAYEALT